eukprot:4340977-Alexandrium_andersonii.AAC.1
MPADAHCRGSRSKQQGTQTHPCECRCNNGWGACPRWQKPKCHFGWSQTGYARVRVRVPVHVRVCAC